MIVIWTVCSVADSAIAQLPSTMACGPRAVAIAAMIANGDLESTSLVSSFDSVQGDHSLAEIGDVVGKLGLRASFARYDLYNPALPDCPVIVSVAREGAKEFHLVVLFGRNGDVVQFIDYPHSPQLLEVSELSRIWSGEGVEVRSIKENWFDLPGVVNSCMLIAGVLIVCLSAFLRTSGQVISLMKS